MHKFEIVAHLALLYRVPYAPSPPLWGLGVQSTAEHKAKGELGRGLPGRSMLSVQCVESGWISEMLHIPRVSLPPFPLLLHCCCN